LPYAADFGITLILENQIGKGLNDCDAIFAELKRVGFNGWISIEDGVDGMDQLERSVTFVKRKVAEYWPS
jgi:sugar phosphate isomerase/epimerase